MSERRRDGRAHHVPPIRRSRPVCADAGISEESAVFPPGFRAAAECQPDSVVLARPFGFLQLDVVVE